MPTVVASAEDDASSGGQKASGGGEGGAEGGAEDRDSAMTVPPPEEPPLGCEGCTTLRLRLPNGKTCSRRFMRADAVSGVFSYAAVCGGKEGGGGDGGGGDFTLHSSYPNRVRAL